MNVGCKLCLFLCLAEARIESVLRHNSLLTSICSISLHSNVSLTVQKIKNGSLVFTPQPLRAMRVMFSPMVSGWVGRWAGKVCPGC